MNINNYQTQNLHNLAIIAHVDHGKTTLIDTLLKQAKTFRENEYVSERVMDSNDIEKERGITILAKCTSIFVEDVKFNIVDTPGHADFGGEVERILSMVDGALLLVDAAEGPMPQTKFVLSKALKIGLCPIVVINKVDRQDERVQEVLDEVFDLFVALGATDKQLDFPIIYASGRSGWAVDDLEKPRENVNDLFDAIKKYVPVSSKDINSSFSMLSTLIEIDPYVGRILIGRIESGICKVNMPVKGLSIDGKFIENAKITKIFVYEGINKIPVQEAKAGDIVAVAGMSSTSVADTICAMDINSPIPAIQIDPPTMSINIRVNDSPLAGQEGKKVTSRLIRERLLKEAESNVAIKVNETGSSDTFEVAGRGELQLGVLIENMRREGFELAISKPKVIFKKHEVTGKLLEPYEELTVDVDDEFSGIVVEKISIRKGQMKDMRPSGGGKTRIIFEIPSRGLIGYQGEFLTDTRGSGILNRAFLRYDEHVGAMQGRKAGVLISMMDGDSVAYALANFEDRGILFIGSGEKVYVGMIIGEHNRDNDLEVNPIKGKQLTNMRTTSKDEAIRLSPPKLITLEWAIAYIDEDELVEVTPGSIRLRKAILDSNLRKKDKRQ